MMFRAEDYEVIILIVSVDDIQVACYKILNALYSLGTGRGAFVERWAI